MIGEVPQLVLATHSIGEGPLDRMVTKGRKQHGSKPGEEERADVADASDEQDDDVTPEVACWRLRQGESDTHCVPYGCHVGGVAHDCPPCACMRV